METNKPIQAYSNALKEICPELNSDEITFMCNKVTITNLKANELYLRAGEIQKSIAFSFRGLLRSFYINDKGEEITIDFTKENTYAADYGAFINQKPSKYYIETLEPCLIVNVPFTAIQECYTKFKNCEKFGRLIAEIHLNKVQNRINSFLFYSAEQRYLHFISRNMNILNRITQTHLSTFLGIKRQTLTRIRKKIIQSI
ncbi:Crp/Fnr family transcriptional regulator [Aquimarina muelleri]|uniref:Crp/Fnr family transcriptional regulator n=1 Tax=Aquimarina muelleri TaxID=279356 RepID=UPI003F68727E